VGVLGASSGCHSIAYVYMAHIAQMAYVDLCYKWHIQYIYIYIYIYIAYIAYIVNITYIYIKYGAHMTYIMEGYSIYRTSWRWTPK